MTVLTVRDFDATTARRLAAEGVPAPLHARWRHVASKLRRDAPAAGRLTARFAVARSRRRDSARGCDRCRFAAFDRCRLRLRWSNRVPRSACWTARYGSARRLPSAKSFRIRIRIDAGDRRPRRARIARPAGLADHRRQRPSQASKASRAQTSSASPYWSPITTCRARCCQRPPASSIRTRRDAGSRASIWRASE